MNYWINIQGTKHWGPRSRRTRRGFTLSPQRNSGDRIFSLLEMVFVHIIFRDSTHLKSETGRRSLLTILRFQNQLIIASVKNHHLISGILDCWEKLEALEASWGLQSPKPASERRFLEDILYVMLKMYCRSKWRLENSQRKIPDIWCISFVWGDIEPIYA